MEKKILTIILFLEAFICSSQISFEAEKVLIEKPEFTSDLNNVLSADLNNDGFNELIVSSFNDDTIMWYKNVDGDLQSERIHYVTTTLETPESIHAQDIDNDGWIDILAASKYGSKVVMFKNLGNYQFSEEIVVNSSIAFPQNLVSEDINNDGFKDVVVGTSDSIVYFLNLGNNTFSDNPTIISSGYVIDHLKLVDIDNDNYIDVFSTRQDGDIYLNKNAGDGTFEEQIFVTSSSDYMSSIDFLDVNNDSYLDLIYSNSNDKLSYRLNQNGQNFSNLVVINIALTPSQISIKDIDNDGKLDVVVSNVGGGIGWIKRNTSSFGVYTSIPGNITNVRDFVVYDVNNDSIKDFIVSCNSTTTAAPAWVLTYFFKNSASSQYQERILNCYLGATRSVRIGDIDNDGFNDIISGYRAIVWNKNMGDGNFSSFRLLNNITSDAGYNIELGDINNDGLLDIAAIKNTSLELYKNLGNGKFILSFSLSFDNYCQEIELCDINGDNKLDILLTFYNAQTKMVKIINLGSFTFSPALSINFSNSYFNPNKLTTGDMDNDGDKDIIVSSKETSSIQLLENDGLGNFSYNNVKIEITTDPILLADLNNDGLLDIVSGGSNIYSPSYIYYLLNNNGSFSNVNYVDTNQSLYSIGAGDFNNDGFIDIVGASVEYTDSNDRVIVYSSNSGSYSKIIVNELGDSLSSMRDIFVGNLNSDDKLDFVTSYYFIGKTDYYINTSPLDVNEYSFINSDFILYPNPTSGVVSWPELGEEYDIKVYNELGQVLIHSNTGTTKSINLNFFNPGIYYATFYNSNQKFSQKIIKK